MVTFTDALYKILIKYIELNIRKIFLILLLMVTVGSCFSERRLVKLATQIFHIPSN